MNPEDRYINGKLNVDFNDKDGDPLSCGKPFPMSNLEEKLRACVFCGEKEQIQVQPVDHKNPERDIIRCRICRGEALRKYWQNPQILSLFASELPEEKYIQELKPCEQDNWSRIIGIGIKSGYNQCLSDIKKKWGIR